MILKEEVLTLCLVSILDPSVNVQAQENVVTKIQNGNIHKKPSNGSHQPY